MYGDEYLKRNLTDPPRHVSLAVGSHLMFGGFLGYFGWCFFGFGMIFFWAFVMHCDPSALWRFRGELETARGTVTSVQQTSFSEGGSDDSDGTPIFAHHYQFTVGGQSFSGTSYRLGGRAEVDTDVTIEFPAGRPERSRIRGLRTAPFSVWVLFVVLFPAIGLLLVLVQLNKGRRCRYLLKYGELAEGNLVSKERTNTEINNQSVYRLTFEFETRAGHTDQIVVKTHNVAPLQDDARETLLYDPTRPSFGTTLDHLPGRPRVNEDGSVSVGKARSAVLPLIAPALTLFGHGTYVLLRYVL